MVADDSTLGARCSTGQRIRTTSGWLTTHCSHSLRGRNLVLICVIAARLAVQAPVPDIRPTQRLPLSIMQEMHRHPPENCAMMADGAIRASRPGIPALSKPFQQSAALAAPRPSGCAIWRLLIRARANDDGKPPGRAHRPGRCGSGASACE